MLPMLSHCCSRIAFGTPKPSLLARIICSTEGKRSCRERCTVKRHACQRQTGAVKILQVHQRFMHGNACAPGLQVYHERPGDEPLIICLVKEDILPVSPLHVALNSCSVL